MLRKTIGALAVGVGLAVIGTGSALAGPVKGSTYVGSLPAYGTANYHHLKMRLHAHGAAIVLTVARNGRTVSVRFSTSYPVMYCVNNEFLKVQSTKPATISSSGSFTAVINDKFIAQTGPPAITQTITGHFSGKHVSGTIYTSAGGCGGAAHYTASA
ncbi:MAG TPA: hypothetical protein VKG38_01130 [Solirubrobacteraceae bacterium]|nr:hypothetical protein [Solirubrobacteraceae bacterium]